MTKEINVLAIARLEEEEVRTIAAVDASVTVHCSVNRDQTAGLLPEADVLLASFRLDIDSTAARRLKWVHFLAAGIDHFFRCRHCGHQLTLAEQGVTASSPCAHAAGHEPSTALPGENVTITTSSGIAAIPIAEYAVSAMLTFARRLPELVRAQANHEWLRQQAFISAELYGKTLGIVGIGHIGERVAVLARSFGMRVVGTRRSAGNIVTGAAAKPADAIYPISLLDDLLAASDFVLVSTPLTPETEGLIGERQLHAMKRTAVLINVSRGRVVDEPALIRALREGEIAGAALDVTAKEPLEHDSPLWDMSNVLVTPHISAVTEPYSTRAVALFCDNLRRYVAGSPLQNVLDRSKAY